MSSIKFRTREIEVNGRTVYQRINDDENFISVDGKEIPTPYPTFDEVVDLVSSGEFDSWKESVLLEKCVKAAMP